MSSHRLTWIPSPFVQVLEMVCASLDGLSLRQLSCTCHHLRSVCFNLLGTRGLVLQSWEKVVDNLGARWIMPHRKVRS